jgi:hypothetical protein
MPTCYRCGGEIIFRPHPDDDRIVPIHPDGSCWPAPARHVPVVHDTVVPFDEAVLGKEVVGVVLNVASRRVHIGEIGTVAAPLRELLACDLRVGDGHCIRAHLPATRRPDLGTVIRVWPREVTLHGDTNRLERALYSDRFEIVDH